jgi:uncharacterized membrane protein
MTVAKTERRGLRVSGRRWRRLAIKLDWSALLVVIFSVFAWAALVGPAYFLNAHDAPHSIFFLNQFDQALRDGVLYPRWGVDFALGYGYPLFNIYSTLPLYVAEAFHLLGASLTGAIKLTYISAFMLSGLTMYAFGKRVLGAQAGLVAAVVYMYAPYRLLDIYVRSAFAEFCALSFLPLVLLLFHDLVQRPSPRRVVLASLAYAALFLSHVATAFIFSMLLVPYVAFLVFSKIKAGWVPTLRVAGLSAAAALFSLALASIFLLPMIAEKAFIVEGQWTQGSFGYAKHFVYPSQLFSPYWGYGYAGEGLADEMSLQLGMAATTLATVGAACSLSRQTRGRSHVVFFLAASVVVVATMMPAAESLWEILPLAAFVQFPWRLLALAVLTMSVLSGGAVNSVLGDSSAADRGLDARVAVLGLVIVLVSYGYTVPQYTEPSSRSEQPVAIIDFESFYPPDRVGMTIWAQEQPQDTPLVEQYLAGEPLVKAMALDEGAQVEMVRHGAASEEVFVNSPDDTELRFLTYYFPGWRGFVDGREVGIYPSGPHGLITMIVPAGEHNVLIRFGDTPARLLGALVSVASLLLALGILIWQWVRERRLT